MNNKTIALLVAGFCAVGIFSAGFAVAAVLLTQHLMHQRDTPSTVATSVAPPADQPFPDQNPRPNGPPRADARADARPGDRGSFQGRGGGVDFLGRPGGGNFQGRGGGGMMMLNEGQRQVLQDAQQGNNDMLRELEEKLRAAQRETLEAALASTPDEKAIRSKAEAMAAIQVEMTMLRAKALSALAPTLEHDQKQQMTDSPFGVMLLNGGVGGGGGGRGGFPGGPGGGRPGFGGPGGGGGFGGGGLPGQGPDNPGTRPDR